MDFQTSALILISIHNWKGLDKYVFFIIITDDQQEKSNHLATGGRSPQVQININPEIDLDISNIVPHLMKTTPVSFKSNISDTEINDVQ